MGNRNSKTLTVRKLENGILIGEIQPIKIHLIINLCFLYETDFRAIYSVKNFLSSNPDDYFHPMCTPVGMEWQKYFANINIG